MDADGTKAPKPDRFVERARRAESLDRETEQALVVRARAGDGAARERLLAANLRHVVALAHKYGRYRVPFSDLVSEGTVGLCVALDRFDPDRGTRFVTYAGHWIRAHVLDFILRQRTLVGGGTGAFQGKVYFRLLRERARLEARALAPAAQRQALATSFGTSEARIEEMLARVEAKDASLDAPLTPGSSTSAIEHLAADAPDAHDELVARRERSLRERTVASALATLDARERRLVERRALADDGVTLASVAREFGVSRERARQIEARAHRKLERALAPLVEAAV